IVNPEMLEIYDNIDPELRDKVEAVVLNTHAGATEELIELAGRIKAAAVPGAPTEVKTDAWRQQPVEARLQYAILNGTAEFVEQDINEALQHYAPLQIVEDVLMQGITKVGELFGEGKMFLPQVVKSAQVMQKAVSYVTPHLSADQHTNRRKALLATVKGDVHDIGKNIVGVVMACNGYEVIDLGVMVPKEKIVEEAVRQQVQAVCLSGLITPSLTEMVEVARALQHEGLDIPLMVGGATTSEKHTALFIDTAYDGPVAHTRDASAIVPVLGKLLTDGNYRMCLKTHYAKIRRESEEAPVMRQHTPVNIDWTSEKIYVPATKGRRELTIEAATLLPLVNWKAFAFDWRVKDAAAEALVREAQAFLQEHLHEFVPKAVVGIYPVTAQKDTLLVEGHTLPMFRNGVCLTDFIAPQGDHIGLFAATVNAESLVNAYKAENDLYHSLMTEFLANRLVEALSEWLHRQMRTEWWGFPSGIRPAVGYSCLPDHRMKRDVFDILDAAGYTGITLTENDAMLPLSSVCGFYFASDKAIYY
ncbi:MAG: B12-binding domain-containing protein, partial [Paludibacteraceae bacterium]|nr:B12-binding domain-containing protein [Paludibacteraceae bacterium]